MTQHGMIPLVLAIVYVIMTVVHETAKGSLTTGTIITIRTPAANLVILIFYVILLIGRTKVLGVWSHSNPLGFASRYMKKRISSNVFT